MSRRWIFVVSLIISFCSIAKASIGDRSNYYIDCMKSCRATECSTDQHFLRQPSFFLWLTFWTCKEECGYQCMWMTVAFFKFRGYSWPQFHGKWPFMRILGLQEPASVLFSLMNFVSHLHYYIKFRQAVSINSPMFFTWTWFAVICMYGWVWSAIFHARDVPFTEAMDYSCAFAMVLTLLYCLLLRITYTGAFNIKVFSIITGLYLATFAHHATTLWSGRIDYDYNMKLNISVGSLSIIITLIWWYRNYHRLPHVHLLGWFTLLTAAVSLLEILDFEPIVGTFDAHSIWHASTSFLVNFIYRFMILDCLYLQRKYMKLKSDLL